MRPLRRHSWYSFTLPHWSASSALCVNTNECLFTHKSFLWYGLNFWKMSQPLRVDRVIYEARCTGTISNHVDRLLWLMAARQPRLRFLFPLRGVADKNTRLVHLSGQSKQRQTFHNICQNFNKNLSAARSVLLSSIAPILTFGQCRGGSLVWLDCKLAIELATPSQGTQ